VNRESVRVKNELLAALPRAAYTRMLPDLESISPSAGVGLYNSGRSIERVYFPEDALVSGEGLEAFACYAVMGGDGS
jgi:hypothetical protein